MILVDVYVPSVDDCYDFMLDENVSIDKVIFEMSEMISKKMKNEKLKNIDEFFLYSLEDKKLLAKDKTLYTSGIKDGSKLLLV